MPLTLPEVLLTCTLARQVNLKLFTPAPNKDRTVLLFVFRDRTKTPLARLVETWEADLQQMWEAITKPPQYESSRFDDFFQVTCLPWWTAAAVSSIHWSNTRRSSMLRYPITRTGRRSFWQRQPSCGTDSCWMVSSSGVSLEPDSLTCSNKMIFVSSGHSPARQEDDKLPGDALALSLSNIWGVIKEQKDLNLPAHKVCVLELPRCNVGKVGTSPAFANR